MPKVMKSFSISELSKIGREFLILGESWHCSSTDIMNTTMKVGMTDSHAVGNKAIEKYFIIDLNDGNVRFPSFAESLSMEDLRHIAGEYEKLLKEHADLFFFKETALKYLTPQQLELIEDELDNFPEYTI